MSVPMACLEKLMPDTAYAPEGVSRIALLKSKKWPNGSQLHYAFRGGTSGQHKQFQKVCEELMQYANLDLKLKPAGTTTAQIRVTFDPNGGAWSYIGTDAERQPKNQPTMNLGFGHGDGQDGTYMHELGHAIGAIHEHQNPKGGIKWNEANVIRDLSGPPNNWDRQTIQQNMFEKYRVDQLNATEFDPKSIMLYAIPRSWTMDGFSSEANAVLSEMDKRWLRDQYPGRGTGGGGGDPPPVYTKVPVYDLKPLYDEISRPGERDAYKFTADRAGNYVVETLGDTPVSLRLFGPNNETNLVHETNNAAMRFNARMDVKLNPGEYLLQVSHLETAGVGKYGVRILVLAESDVLSGMSGKLTIEAVCPIAPGTWTLAKAG